MKTLLAPRLFTLAGLLRSRALLHLEILPLRQQLSMVTARDHKRLRTRRPSRLRPRLHHHEMTATILAWSGPGTDPNGRRTTGSETSSKNRTRTGARGTGPALRDHRSTRTARPRPGGARPERCRGIAHRPRRPSRNRRRRRWLLRW